MHLAERALDFVLALEVIVFLRRPVKVNINESADLPAAGKAELLARVRGVLRVPCFLETRKHFHNIVDSGV